MGRTSKLVTDFEFQKDHKAPGQSKQFLTRGLNVKLGKQNAENAPIVVQSDFLGVPHLYKEEPYKPKPKPNLSYHSRTTLKYGGLWDESCTISLIIQITVMMRCIMMLLSKEQGAGRWWLSS